MATLKRKFLEHQKTRHGRMVWYFRRAKSTPRIRLPDNPDSAEFDAAYWAALNGETVKKSQTPTSSIYFRENTFGWLVTRYQAECIDWIKLHESTKRARNNILKPMLRNHGQKPFTILSEATISRAMLARINTPAQANEFLQILRNLLKWAKKQRIVANNPALEVAFYPKSKTGFKAWTIEAVEKYRATHEIGTMARLAIEMALHTGLRRSDLIRLSPSHVKDGKIRITLQKKPNPTVTLPMHADLAGIIKITPRNGLTYLETKHHAPYTCPGFTNAFREWARMAALTEFSPHGGRKHAATLLAEAGASTLQLMAAFGWSKADMAELYTKSAARDKLSIDAWTLLEQKNN
ncbi:MAG: Integrase / recombinase [Hyphomonadaceae bacterium]|nr:MAG: Integrase / recombinase [Hyphomonadaceae bacterium]KAF0182709.1 MAG: Integrase / recombinase [Hyphomonadaceae bacterium]